jgi:large subunit ribosomal protein L4
VKEAKTKQFVKLVASSTPEEKVLVISKAFDEVTYKAARNVQPAQLATSAEVNTEQLLAFKKIIVTNDALSQLAERTSK